MHRNGFAIIMVTFAAVTLIGCEPKNEAPVSPAGGAHGSAKTVFGTDVSATSANVDLHAITGKNGSVVVWRDKVSPFYVVFSSSDNPCNPSGGPASNIYMSTQNANGGNVVTCTIAATPVGSGPYPYFIYGGVPPQQIDGIKVPTTTDHCEGCLLEVDDQ